MPAAAPSPTAPRDAGVDLFGIPNCDTVRRARAWLAEHGVAVRFHDFKRGGMPADRLAAWTEHVGHASLVNRRGSTWRTLDADTQARAEDAAGARAVLLAHPSLAKRPVVEWPDGRVTVGFDSVDWARRVG